MSENVAIRPDVRLDDGPMQEVPCRACSAVVEVRKSSWEQTSIQWTTAAIAQCRERRPGSDGADTLAFEGCRTLSESIHDAVADGTLTVQSGDPLPVNTEPDDSGDSVDR